MGGSPAWPAANDGRFGQALAFGDWNADGYDNLVVGSPLGTTAPSAQGRAYVFDGAAGGPDAKVDWSYAHGEANAQLGYGVLFTDVDKDGYDEVILGAHLANDVGTDRGQVLVFRIQTTDADNDGFKTPTDCDDNDKTVYPGAPETTYGRDMDCDGNWLCYQDNDSDSYGSSVLIEETDADKNCNEPIDKVADDSTDCNDADAAYHPGAADVVYGLDMDCDGNLVCYADVDKDGYGSKTVIEETDKDKNCDEPLDSVANDNTDCLDSDAAVHPGATEDTYGKDKDCDGNLTCYADADQDGYGTTPLVEETDADLNCDEPVDKVANDGTDCKDSDAAYHPTATEDTYGLDKNCDLNLLCYKDADKDGYGSVTLIEEVDKDGNCDEKLDSVANDNTDCKDSDNAYFPGATEDTYGVDKDCDLNILCYEDLDQDTYGSSVLVEEADKDGNCDEWSDSVANDKTDCLDTNKLAHPGAVELVGDGVDGDCNNQEQCYKDNDQDGFGSPIIVNESNDVGFTCDTVDKEAKAPDDCNDANSSITVGIAEVIGDGIDQDCDGKDNCYIDADKDGHALSTGALMVDATGNGCLVSDGEGGPTTPRDDCDDTNNLMYPGAVEIVGDGFDNNCDGAEVCYVDFDKDKYAPTTKATVAESSDGDTLCETADGEATSIGPFTDCDDATALRNPGISIDICGNGIDENCDGIGDGALADDDGDGLPYGKESASGSSDCLSDSDADGVGDLLEFGGGSLAKNTDGIDQPDILDTDDDNDGVATKTEGSVLDTDSDGKKNYVDDDDDGDGILSSNEGASVKLDTDADGTYDYLDTDDDGDGIASVVEGIADTDGDGIKNYLDADDDADGVLTKNEGPATKDTDGDLVPDYLDSDDDGDGVLTKVEVLVGDTDSDGTKDYLDTDDDGDTVATKIEGLGDPDSDGKPNYLDDDDDGDTVLSKLEGTKDTDGDGSPDLLDADDDGDRVPTKIEGGTKDTDGDGAKDYLDSDDDDDSVPTVLEDGNKDGNPVNDDADNDGKPNYLDTDDDNDGVSTRLEDADHSGTAANDDADADGLPNYLDSDDDNDGVLTSKEDTNKNKDWYDDDVDNDGLPDFLDNDDDNDGVPTVVEDTNGNKDPTDDDADGDGKPNYLDTDDDNDGIATKDEDVNRDKNWLNDDADKDGTPNYLDNDDDGDKLLTKNELTADSDGDGLVELPRQRRRQRRRADEGRGRRQERPVDRRHRQRRETELSRHR